MSWVCERSPTATTTTTTTTTSALWKKVFLSLKGSELYLYETPPVSPYLLTTPCYTHNASHQVTWHVFTRFTFPFLCSWNCALKFSSQRRREWFTALSSRQRTVRVSLIMSLRYNLSPAVAYWLALLSSRCSQ